MRNHGDRGDVRGCVPETLPRSWPPSLARGLQLSYFMLRGEQDRIKMASLFFYHTIILYLIYKLIINLITLISFMIPLIWMECVVWCPYQSYIIQTTIPH